MNKREKKLKLGPRQLRTPLWLLHIKGYMDASKGGKYGDTKSRVQEFADKRIKALKHCRKGLRKALTRFSDDNCLVKDTNLIAVSLAENEDRYKINGVEKETDRIFKEQRKKQLKSSIVKISDITEKAERKANDRRSEYEEQLDDEIRAYYRGLAKYLRKHKGYKKIDPNAANLRCFTKEEDLSVFDDLLIFVPRLKETMAALGD